METSSRLTEVFSRASMAGPAADMPAPGRYAGITVSCAEPYIANARIGTMPIHDNTCGLAGTDIQRQQEQWGVPSGKPIALYFDHRISQSCGGISSSW